MRRVDERVERGVRDVSWCWRVVDGGWRAEAGTKEVVQSLATIKSRMAVSSMFAPDSQCAALSVA